MSSKWKPQGLLLGVAPMGQALWRLPLCFSLWPLWLWVSWGACGALSAVTLLSLRLKLAKVDLEG